MQAGDIAVKTGLATVNKRWCDVDFLTFESKVAAHIHVLGDAVQAASAMPKSGHMANQHGKTCAAAVVALLTGKAVNPQPIYTNTCYSFVSDKDVIHVASVHAYDAEKKPCSPWRVPAACLPQRMNLKVNTPRLGRATSGPTRSRNQRQSRDVFFLCPFVFSPRSFAMRRGRQFAAGFGVFPCHISRHEACI